MSAGFVLRSEKAPGPEEALLMIRNTADLLLCLAREGREIMAAHETTGITEEGHRDTSK